ncbi:MAG: hypothetical protein HQL57_08440 [Magnetococcales bacterium]|nr:hypothetical protein [Magnetococcales bacterium]MBF0157195.1 hypothetical protein [Magnetococcales bacterium]
MTEKEIRGASGADMAPGEIRAELARLGSRISEVRSDFVALLKKSRRWKGETVVFNHYDSDGSFPVCGVLARFDL